MVKINGSSFALQYKRTTSRPIDSTEVFDTIEDTRVYARNTDTEAYAPYAGQIVTVKTGGSYQLVEDSEVTLYPERKHYKLVRLNNTNDNDDRYLRRDIAETVQKLMTFLEGINVEGMATIEEITLLKNIVSQNFSVGSTGMGIYQDEKGNYHLDIDFVNIRKKFTTDEIEVQKSYYVGGKQWITPGAGIVCISVEDTGTAYRCRFKTTDAEGCTVRCMFQPDDLAICETFNMTKQSGGTLGNHYYWRLVTDVGADYIDLSKSDCGAGSEAPQVGDEIVHLGNKSDAGRQGAICSDAITAGGPYIRVYKGINDYHLPQPKIDLNPKESIIKAKLVSEATGKDMDETLSDLQADMELIHSQTDKEYTLWFFEYDPALDNIPASDWTTAELKEMHEQDMFYNRTTGHAWRFEKNADGSFSWNEITDQLTLKALENAAKAQDTADGKRRTFVAQPTDADAYDVGDQWVNATYTDEGVTYENDSLVCKTAKKSGVAFSISHWQPTSTVTTAVIRNLGNRITQVVSGLADTDKAVAEAERLAEQGIDDAYDAYSKAQEALGIAENADSAAYANSTVIQQTKDSITALANRISFDSNGNISNINTSGLVTTADFAALTGKEIVYDKDGHVDMTKTAGLVTTANFAQMFSERVEADGYVTKSYIATFMTELPDGRFQSNAIVDADLIRFNGNIVANDTFVVDTEGNLTLNKITVNGEVYADKGDLAGWKIETDNIRKNNVVFGSDGSIYNSNGSWYLGNDDTGYLADNKIQWKNGNLGIQEQVTVGVGKYEDFKVNPFVRIHADSSNAGISIMTLDLSGASDPLRYTFLSLSGLSLLSAEEKMSILEIYNEHTRIVHLGTTRYGFTGTMAEAQADSSFKFINGFATIIK